MSGIYIHIPFCIRKCLYCDFVSFPNSECVFDDYINALIREIELTSAHMGKFNADTVFIGGGTPSILGVGGISKILTALYANHAIADNAEVTVECNPGTLTRDKLSEYRDCGVNRLSIGLQSANDGVLKAIGRIHSFDEFIRSYELAVSCGFDNINIDIMYGLPTQTRSILNDTIKTLLDINPTHISAYSLILEEGTPLYDSVESGKVLLPDEDSEYEMHRLIIDTLKASGYNRYEISNYSHFGFECRHNLNYWDCGEYLGLGVAAHGAIRADGLINRYENTSSLGEYMDLVNSGKLPVIESNIISSRDEMDEYLMLGLRKICGIDKSEFEGRFQKSVHDVFGEPLMTAISDGYIEEKDNRIFMTDIGLDMQNTILSSILFND